MARVDELRVMTKVASLYFEKGYNQLEIANQLDLSQATISRLLKRAQQEQIVRISINPPHGTYSRLEETLQNLYGLKEAIVVDCESDVEDLILRQIGSAAAFYLENTVKHNEVVGISSWSATLLSMVDAMHPLPRPNGVQVVQILGGIGNPEAETHANHLTTRMASLLRGSARFLPAPGVVGSSDTVRLLMTDTFIQQAVELFDHVTLALVGIGGLEPSGLLASSGNIFTPDELDLLRQEKAVGDICLRFFKADGTPVRSPLNERVISMKLEQLRKVKRAVGIAGGKRKFDAIAGAVRGRWINVLITDRFTAERLVSRIKNQTSLVGTEDIAYEKVS